MSAPPHEPDGVPPADRRLPGLSVVVIVHNIPAQAARTLLSLSADYQRDVDPDDYEVIVVDNGSTPPCDTAAIARLSGCFRVIRLDPASPSPAQAINAGLRAARGDVIGVMVDGARLATPGLLHFAHQGARLYPQPVVVTLGWYLGADFQAMSALAGHDAAAEQALLDRIGWPRDGYRLYEIGTPDESSSGGWFPHAGGAAEPVLETNALFLRRAAWEALGGADERFDLPGGGLLNVDLYRRALALPDARVVVPLGEATFHQVHGGIATNAPPDEFRRKMRRWFLQYASLRGLSSQPPQPERPPTYIGTLPPGAAKRMVRGAIDPIRRPPLTPAGPAFDLWSWSVGGEADDDRDAPPGAAEASDANTTRTPDRTQAALDALIEAEFRAGRYDAVAVVARLARRHAPHAPGPQRVLSIVAPYFDERGGAAPPRSRSAAFHAAVGRANVLIGDRAAAAAAFRLALEIEPGRDDFRQALADLGAS